MTESGMHILRTADGSTVSSPGNHELEAAIHGLSSTGAFFATLEREPESYIQARLLDDGLLDLEFRDGTFDRHYAAPPQSRAAVASAFQAFHAGNNTWRTAFEWRRVPFPPPPERAGRLHIVSDENLQVLLGGERPVVLAFVGGTPKMAQAYHSVLVELAALLEDKLTVAEVDLVSSPQAMRDWGVSTTPTTLVFRAGVMQRVLLGVRPTQRLIQDVRVALAF